MQASPGETSQVSLKVHSLPLSSLWLQVRPERQSEATCGEETLQLLKLHQTPGGISGLPAVKSVSVQLILLQELYPDMYKLHETNQINSEPEKKEPDGKDCLVDVGREGGVVAFGEILESQTQQRYIADHQFEEGNKTSEVTRYLISEDYCERYQDSRYSDIANQDHHRLMLDQRERLLPVEMFHKMKNINQ